MARRDRDPRPTIEVIGGTSSAESVQEVDLGGGTGGRDPRWWKALLAGLVLVIGAVALTGGDDDGGESAASTSTTRGTVRRTTTTGPTTSTTLGPIGPVLDEPTGGVSLLLAGQVGKWALLDLDTGVFTEVERLERGDVYSGVVSVRGGVAMTDGNVTRYVPLLDGGEPVELGGGGNLLASGRDDRVWVGDQPMVAEPVELQLVDLRGRVLARSEMPANSYYGATAFGPVLYEGGRTFLLTEDGPRLLGIGDPVGNSADRVAVRECGERGTCTTSLVHVVTGEVQVLEELTSEVGDGVGFGGSVQISPDGDIVTLDYDIDGNPDVRWLEPSGAVLAEGHLEVAPNYGFGGELSFLPGRLGVIWSSGSGELTRAWPSGGKILVEEIPISSTRQFDRAIVVRP